MSVQSLDICVMFVLLNIISLDIWIYIDIKAEDPDYKTNAEKHVG